MNSHTKDISGFNRIYAENKDMIYRIALKYSDNNADMAQEATQDAFLQLYKYFDTFDEDYLTAWLVTTVKNIARNYMKKANREICAENICLTLEQSETGIVESAEDALFGRMRQEEEIVFEEELLGELFAKNERWYEAMTMVYCMERKQTDVAEELGISTEVLHSILYRAKQWIQKYYDSQKEHGYTDR